MEVKSIELNIIDTLVTLSSSTTREELINALGDPDEITGVSDEHKNGSILKYIDTEFHFMGDLPTDNLALIYQEMEIDGKYFPEYSIKLK